jgi:hypothetical protein
MAAELALAMASALPSPYSAFPFCFSFALGRNSLHRKSLVDAGLAFAGTASAVAVLWAPRRPARG